MSGSSFIAFLAASSFVSAANIHHDVRQASQSAPASSTAVSAPASGPAPASGTAVSTLTFSLHSTNPTAVPLSSINPTEATSATIPLAQTPQAGTTPSAVSNAPALPNAASIAPSSYPSLDVKPPNDSPEVKQWIQDVASSGVSIPNITVTVAGGCPTNPDAVNDKSRCWWTCGGCVRSTDISDCPNKNTWGLTYDDGPSFYTPNLLTYLDQINTKATFFVVGSRAISFPQTLQAEYLAGHQLAVHTWSHPALTTLETNDVIAELGWTKKVIKDITGVTPLYFRPPFGDLDDRVRAISKAMNLIPVMWTRQDALTTFDTGDFDIHAGTVTSQQVMNNWNGIVANVASRNSGFIVLEHDLFEQTVQMATGYILPDAISRNITMQPVVTCLNQPLNDAYIELNDNKTNPLPVSASGVATLSSGAPGSAQATSASHNGAVGFAGTSWSLAGTLTIFAALFWL